MFSCNFFSNLFIPFTSLLYKYIILYVLHIIKPFFCIF
nr:MAG TPA: hypothetical protein [Caudoviricetes sp.]